MVQKRVSRARKRDLEQPDKIATFLHKLLAFAGKYKVHLLSALGVIVAAIIAMTGVLYFTNKAENKAFTLLGQGLNKYKTIAADDGPGKAYLEAADDLQLILNKYSGKEAGKIARIMLANFSYDAANYDKAIALYNQSLRDVGDNPFFKYLVLSCLGYAHEAQKDYKTAANYFEMIASAPDYSMRDEALFNLAGVYAAMGNYDQRTDALKKIISDHNDSFYLEIVKEIISGYPG